MRNNIIIIVIALLIGGVLGHYLTSPKDVTKTVTVEKEIIKHDVKTVIVKNPNGSTTTTIVDNSTETKDKRKDVLISTTTEKNRLLSLAGKRTTDKYIYEAAVQFRAIGPIFIGVSANTNKELGAIMTLEF